MRPEPCTCFQKHILDLARVPSHIYLYIISTVGVAEVNLCFYCTALTRIHTIHTVRAEGSLVRSDSGLELVQALLPAGRLQAADRRLI